MRKVLIARKLWERLGISFDDLEDMDPREVSKMMIIFNTEDEMEAERIRLIENQSKSRH